MLPQTEETEKQVPEPRSDDGGKDGVKVVRNSQSSSFSQEAGITISVEPSMQDIERTETLAVEQEVFGSEGKFRTLSWMEAAIIFAKMTIGVGVLSIPSAMKELGAVAGSIFIVFWGLLNTYGAYLLGQYKIAHPSVHGVADGANILALAWSGGKKKVASVVKTIVEIDFIFAWIVCGGVTQLAITIAFNAVSNHAICTVAFGAIVFFIVATTASIKTLQDISWIAWAGFVSIVAAVLTVVIAATQRGRPAAAPQNGPYDLGFNALPPDSTNLAAAWSAALQIFSSSANIPAFVPIISELKNPQKYFKAVYFSMGFINSAYLALGLTMFAYCGQWVTNPALGSAGHTIGTIAYAIAIPGLIAGATITSHVAAKTVFVRILRNGKHLENNSKTHWITWFLCTYGLTLISWIVSAAIPFFGSLVSLIGALGFAPLGVCLPALFGLHMNPSFNNGNRKQKLLWLLHVAMFVVGLFTVVVGSYAVIKEIVDQYNAGNVGSPFSCADNSISTVNDFNATVAASV